MTRFERIQKHVSEISAEEFAAMNNVRFPCTICEDFTKASCDFKCRAHFLSWLNEEVEDCE